MKFRPAFCSSCKAPLLWALNTKNKWMPLDAKEVADGVRFQVDNPSSPEPRAYTTMMGWGHRNHFATCPNAEDHRRPKPRDPQRELF